MGGRGSSSGISNGPRAKEHVAQALVASGGKRWQKNGNDRVYLSKAMGYELDLDAPGAPPYASRSVRNIVHDVVSSAYYDVKTGTLEYKKSRYDWANNHVESEYKKLLKSQKKK